MKFGICASFEDINRIEKMGFDYIECSLASLAACTEEEFKAIQEMVSESTIKPRRFNLLLPKTLSLVGPGAAEPGEIREYLVKAFTRMKTLGGEVVVFGSGKCRNVPEGISFQECYRDLVRATKLIGRVAGYYGITVAIEPLNCGETNMINSVVEGAMLQADADMASVQLLADYFHMEREGEPVSAVVKAGKLAHTHIAVGEGRRYPLEETEELKSFFAALHKTGYDGCMSIEGKTENMDQDGPAALYLLRKLDNEAGEK